MATGTAEVVKKTSARTTMGLKDKMSAGVKNRQQTWLEAVTCNAICNSSVGAAGLLSPAARVSSALPASSIGSAALRAAAYHVRRSAVYITSVRALSYAGIPPGVAVGTAMAATTALHAMGRPSTRSLASTASLCGVEWTCYLSLRERFPISGDPVRGAAAGAFATALATTLVLPVTTGVKARSLLSLRTLHQLSQRALEAGKQSALWYGLFEGIRGLAYAIDSPRQATFATSRPSPISEKPSLQQPAFVQTHSYSQQPSGAQAGVAEALSPAQGSGVDAELAGHQRHSDSSSSSSAVLQPFELPHLEADSMKCQGTNAESNQHHQERQQDNQRRQSHQAQHQEQSFPERGLSGVRVQPTRSVDAQSPLSPHKSTAPRVSNAKHANSNGSYQYDSLQH